MGIDMTNVRSTTKSTACIQYISISRTHKKVVTKIPFRYRNKKVEEAI